MFGVILTMHHRFVVYLPTGSKAYERDEHPTCGSVCSSGHKGEGRSSQEALFVCGTGFQIYIPGRYRPIKYCTIGAAKMWTTPSGTYPPLPAWAPLPFKLYTSLYVSYVTDMCHRLKMTRSYFRLCWSVDCCRTPSAAVFIHASSTTSLRLRLLKMVRRCRPIFKWRRLLASCWRRVIGPKPAPCWCIIAQRTLHFARSTLRLVSFRGFFDDPCHPFPAHLFVPVTPSGFCNAEVTVRCFRGITHSCW